MSAKQARAKANINSLKGHLQGMEFLGEVVTYSMAKGRDYSHADVVAALTAASLDTDNAKELNWRYAFDRAAKKMEADGLIVIDQVNEDPTGIKFQLTRKALKEEEWIYAKETYLELDKDNGKVKCKIPALQKVAQDSSKHLQRREDRK